MIEISPKNILIIRLSAIGDIVMASALLNALHQAYPNAKISWLVDESNLALLIDHPKLDRVFIWPRKRWANLIKSQQFKLLYDEFISLVKDLRKIYFDLTLDAQGLLKSGIWAWLSRSKLRIGLGSKEGSQWLMHKTVSRQSDDPRIGIEYRMLLNEIGISDAVYEMDIFVSDADKKEAVALLNANSITQPFLVICPFTTRAQKHWFDERWIELTDRIYRERGLKTVILGGPLDRDHASDLCQRSSHLISLAGLTSLSVSAAIIQSAHALIGVDTGLTHLGIALKTPTLALFGSTRPYLDTCVPYALVLYEPRHCSPCYRSPICNGEFNCMRFHHVTNVMHALNQII